MLAAQKPFVSEQSSNTCIIEFMYFNDQEIWTRNRLRTSCQWCHPSWQACWCSRRSHPSYDRIDQIQRENGLCMGTSDKWGDGYCNSWFEEASPADGAADGVGGEASGHAAGGLVHRGEVDLENKSEWSTGAIFQKKFNQQWKQFKSLTWMEAWSLADRILLEALHFLKWTKDIMNRGDIKFTK